MPFYKKTDTEILTGVSTIYHANYTLSVDNHATYTYPVDGWYWFDTFDIAVAFFATPANTISNRQARLALLNRGLLDAVTAAMVTMPKAAQVEWEFASVISRDSLLVSTVSTGLGMTSADIDALFIYAKTL